MEYRKAWDLQHRLVAARKDRIINRDLVLFLEHSPVFTMGRRGGLSNLTVSEAFLKQAEISVIQVERGGDITYHGPGQLVGYPIVDLNRWKRDLHWYLRQLEQTLIDALGELGLTSFRYPAFTGVWVGDESALDDSGRATGQVRKIGSIGVHVSRWVTWHGFALNVTDEPLRNFDLIVPCGIDEVRMTTLQSEGAIFDAKAVSRAIGRGLAGAFECEVWTAPPVLAGDRPAFEAACVTAGLR